MAGTSGRVGVCAVGTCWFGAGAVVPLGIVIVQPGRISPGSVKVAPPGSLRSALVCHITCQSSTPWCVPIPDRVSPTSTVTSSPERPVSVTGAKPVASDGITSTMPDVISFSAPIRPGLSFLIS